MALALSDIDLCSCFHTVSPEVTQALWDGEVDAEDRALRMRGRVPYFGMKGWSWLPIG